MTKRACLIRHDHFAADLLFRREAIGLRDYGFEVDVLCLRGKDQPATEVIDDVHVYHLPLNRTKGGILRYLIDYLSFFVLVAWTVTVRHLRRPYAFIQVNSMPDFMVFATLVPRLLGAKIMLQMYEPTPELWATRLGLTQIEHLESVSRRQRLFIGALRRIEQACLRYAHSSFAVTKQLKDNFVAHGADPSKITVILNVPDENLFQVEAEEEGPDDPARFQNDNFRLLCHGAIEERYGHDNMLRAVAALKATIPGLELHITGSGSYRDELVAQIELLGLQDHVKYLGWVSLAELVAELKNADAGIVAQKSSTYSNLVHTGKMYDFLAFGKPVIVSRLNAVEAYFDDDSLCYFIAGDSDDLARAILELYEHPDRRLELARNAKRLYGEYCWEKQREKYWAAYAKLDR